MRMEELSNSQYIKSTDSVEKYLLNIIQQYFKSNNIASENSREYIIQKAVARMKDELDFDSLGVLSIVMPDGEVRTGNVTVTLEELGGEPLILPKRTAFNVDFGSEVGTACEGNDPRLSDKRLPLAHKHKIDDIKNLSNELSSIKGKIDRIISHSHNNKDILDRIIYTGTRSSIDLADVDNIEDNIRQLIQQNNTDIALYTDIINNKITQLNSDISILNQQIIDLRQFVIDRNTASKQEVIDYMDTAIDAANATIRNEMSNLVTASNLVGVLAVANATYTHLGNIQVQLNAAYYGATNNQYEIDASSILSQISTLHPVLSPEDVVVQTSLRTSGGYTYNLPYIIIDSDEFKGMITTSCDDNKVTVHFDTTSIPSDVLSGTLHVDYYTRQTVTL